MRSLPPLASVWDHMPDGSEPADETWEQPWTEMNAIGRAKLRERRKVLGKLLGLTPVAMANQAPECIRTIRRIVWFK